MSTDNAEMSNIDITANIVDIFKNDLNHGLHLQLLVSCNPLESLGKMGVDIVRVTWYHGFTMKKTENESRKVYWRDLSRVL